MQAQPERGCVVCSRLVALMMSSPMLIGIAQPPFALSLLKC